MVMNPDMIFCIVSSIANLFRQGGKDTFDRAVLVVFQHTQTQNQDQGIYR